MELEDLMLHEVVVVVLQRAGGGVGGGGGVLTWRGMAGGWDMRARSMVMYADGKIKNARENRLIEN